MRFVRTQSEQLATRNGEVDQASFEDSEGIGVRVRVGGAWGFAAVRGTGKADAEQALERALAIAAAQPAAPGAALADEPPAIGTYTSPASGSSSRRSTKSALESGGASGSASATKSSIQRIACSRSWWS